LVTGGAGFIGSHLVDALVARGDAVVVYDDLSMGSVANVPSVAEFVEGDIRNTAKLAQALCGVDAVFHLAARVSIRSSADHFVEDADINVLGTLSLLRACAGLSVQKLVFASSMGVYADSVAPVPVAESYPTRPISPYGIGKLASESYCLQICPTLGIQPVALRFFNTYGTRQTFTPYVGVITIFVRKLLAGEPPVIFGNGEQCRDFIHVSDLVAANLLALDSDVSECVINVGTGQATSVNEIAELLCARIAPQIRPQYAERVQGELQNCVADITLARKLLGYEPNAAVATHIDEVIEYLRTPEAV
jgi:UDP-glucose 4-epimerase